MKANIAYPNATLVASTQLLAKNEPGDTVKCQRRVQISASAQGSLATVTQYAETLIANEAVLTTALQASMPESELSSVELLDDPE